MASSLLQQLNPAQRAACEHTEGPVLILAGAGSGKTRTLTHRIAYIIEQQLAEPHQVLAVTFTRKATQEMNERLIGLLGGQPDEPVVCVTFHGLALRILRSCATALDFPRRFTILDADDSLELIKISLAAVAGDDEKTSAATARGLRAWISWQKNHGITPEQLRAEGDLTPQQIFDLEVWEDYQARLHKVGALDLDDMIIYAAKALDTPVGREAWAGRFRYISVDEYQDTNTIQYDLLVKLAAAHGNLCVIGDDAQSIYRFRGAKVEHILRFEEDFPESTVYKLEDNYRSTPQILEAANAVIEHSQQSIPKTLRPNRPEGEPVRLIEFNNADEEAERVVADLHEQVMENALSYEDVAIMYRTNRQARVLEEKLRAAEVPYRVLDGTEFYQRSEIKTSMAYLRLFYNPYEVVAFRRAISNPRRKVGPKAMEALERYMEKTGASFLDSANEAAQIEGMSKVARSGMLEFAHAYNSALEDVGDGTLSLLMERLYHYAGLQEHLVREEGGDDWRWQNVLELMDDARRFDHLDLSDALNDFLEHVALQLSPAEEEQAERVTLLTLHSAKGLEYPHVYLVGLEEALWKLEGMIEEDAEHLEEIEEARRLLYVGVTRAMDRLTMCHAAARYNRFRGGWNSQDAVLDEYPPLRFLHDMPPEVIRFSLVERMPRPSSSRQDSDRFAPSNRRTFAMEQPVVHPRFGEGNVVGVGVGRVEVIFEDGITRSLLPGMIRPLES